MSTRRRSLIPHSGVRLQTIALMAVLSCACASALAQGHGGGPPGGGGGGMGGGMGGPPPGGPGRGGPFGSNSSPDTRNSPPPGQPNGGPTNSTMRGGLQLGPPGRWWDDPQFAQAIGLDSRQQHRMDDVFGASKGTLVKLYKNLQHEESQLEKTTRGKELDETTIFQQIDRVTQARGELEKANAHMLLQIRKEMTPQQVALLDEHRGDAQ